MDIKMMRFTPRPDITAFELAQAMAVFGLEIDKAIFRTLDPNTARHFVENTDATPSVTSFPGPIQIGA